jgi:hypothetical protein
MAAHAFASALKKGGTLVIDYFNEKYVEQGLIPEETIEKEDIRFDIKRKINSGKIVKQINVIDDDGIEHCYQERVSAFELKDFVSLFKAENMELTEYFGDYDLRSFDENHSPRLIMIFKKL